MAGYTRQSTADIIPTATVRAAPINAEYNAIRDAFAASGGHKHDGTAGEGEYVPLIADLDALNKIAVDTNNNRFGVFVEVSATAVEQVRFQDGVIVPVTDNDIDLGTSALEFKNLYLDGTAKIDTLTVDENATVAGTLGVTGATTLSSTLGVTGNTTLGGTLGVTGATTLSSTLAVTGTSTFTGAITASGGVVGNLTGNITSTGSSSFSTVDINGGTIDGTAIGATTASTGEFTTVELSSNLSVTGTSSLTGDVSMAGALAVTGNTTGSNISASGTLAATGDTTLANLSATGTSTLTTVDINGGAIDGTTIGASGHTTGKFTTLQSTGLATLNSVNIDGGAIDGTTIGATTTSSGAFTTVSASGGFTGALTGNVTGNVTGDLTGDVTGDVTGNLTGNVTSSGSSSFNNVTIDGTLNMNAGTTATITNLTSPTNTNDAATKGYVDTQVANLVDSAPGTLDTLNELAAALGDDPDFATTVTDSIATKLPLAGGTMTGAIAMGTSKITGLGDPTAAQDAATKNYVDTQDALQVTKSGDSMSGNLAMGSNNITGLATPTANDHATNKSYVDGILGSATAASASAAAAATSETNAATSESNAANSASAAAASYDAFDDRYLGAKSTAPTTDNDGDALSTGALYFNTTDDEMYVWNGSTWYNVNPDLVNDNTPQLGGDLQSNGFDIDMADNDKVTFGNSQDLQIYHDGSHARLRETTGDFRIQTTSGGVNALVAKQNAEVELYYAGSEKLATTSSGVDVTGTLVSDGLTTETSDGIPLTINGGANASFVQFTGGTADDFRFGTVNSKGTLSVTNSTDDRYVLDIANNGDIQFYNSDGSAAKFHWDAADERLGVGTISPTEKLHVQNSEVGVIARFRSDTANGQHVRIASTSTGVQVGSGFDTGINGSFDITSGGGNSYITLSPAGTEAVRIKNNGSVGVGTDSPLGKLDVSDGTNPLSFDSGASYNEIQSYNRPLLLNRQGNNVGIGTDNPLNPLHVSASKSNAVVSYFNNTDTADGNGILVRGGGSNSLKYVASFEDAAANTRMKILANGNVGIGTDNPTYGLDVEDDTGGYIKASFVSTGSAHSSITFDNTGSTANSVRVGSQNNDFYVRTSGTEKARIDASGNVFFACTSNPVSSSANEGLYYEADGYLAVARSNGVVQYLNRHGGDGEILVLRSDGVDASALGAFRVAGKTSTSEFSIYEFAHNANLSGCEVLMKADNGTDAHLTKLNVITDGTDAYLTEYGTVMTGDSLFTVTADISGNFVRIRVTQANTTSTDYNIHVTEV